MVMATLLSVASAPPGQPFRAYGNNLPCLPSGHADEGRRRRQEPAQAGPMRLASDVH